MTLPKLTAIITSHRDTPNGMIQNLEDQTVRPAHLLVGTSEWAKDVVASNKIPMFREQFPNHNDFGYRKRNKMLKMVETEYVGFFNHDDSYDLSYCEKMLTAALENDADVVHCSWNQNQGNNKIATVKPTRFEPGVATLGSFIVRTSEMLEIGGFPTDITDDMRMYIDDVIYNWQGLEADIMSSVRGCSDARAIWKLVRRGVKTAVVKDLLYHSNIPYKGIVRATKWGKAI